MVCSVSACRSSTLWNAAHVLDDPSCWLGVLRTERHCEVTICLPNSLKGRTWLLAYASKEEYAYLCKER